MEIDFRQYSHRCREWKSLSSSTNKRRFWSKKGQKHREKAILGHWKGRKRDLKWREILGIPLLISLLA